MLAMYFPKPGQFVESVCELALAYFVLGALACWLKMSFARTALLMLAGVVLTLGPALASQKDDAGWGEHARKMGQPDYGDAFYAATAYLHVGAGKPVALVGMLAGLALSGLWPKSVETSTVGKSAELRG